VSGDVLTAAQMNQDVRDNFKAMFPTDQTAWTTYTPTLTQSAALTSTATSCRWFQVGGLIMVSAFVTMTGGASVAANVVTLGLPSAAKNTAVGVNLPLFGGRINDSSAGIRYYGWTMLLTTTTMAIVNTSDQQLGVAGFGLALASPDTVHMSAVYEAA
jgi:hypothetical protein